MGLISCPDCGNIVSDQYGVKYPQCGCFVSKRLEEINIQNLQIQNAERIDELKKEYDSLYDRYLNYNKESSPCKNDGQLSGWWIVILLGISIFLLTVSILFAVAFFVVGFVVLTLVEKDQKKKVSEWRSAKNRKNLSCKSK